MGSQPIGISASRGAAILGLSKWKTPTESWLEIMEERQPGFCEKHNYAKPEPVDNASIRWGKAFESAVIELAQSQAATTITGRERLFAACQYDGAPSVTCHVDGIYGDKFESHNPMVLHEGKTTTEYSYRENFGEPGTDQVPIEYQIQCQHQLICTGAEKVILSVLVFPKRPEEWEEMGFRTNDNEASYELSLVKYDEDQKFQYRFSPNAWATVLKSMGYLHQYTITPRPELQEKMLSHYSRFWTENVLKEIPPEPVNIDDIKKLYRDPVGTIVADDYISRLASELRDIQSELGDGGALKKRIEQIKTEIMKFIVDSEKIADDDSQDKFILRDATGKKLASYSKNKNGQFVFR